MPFSKLLLSFTAAFMCLLSAEAQLQTMKSQMVTVEGYDLHVTHSGFAGRKPGSPVVVFEAGATNSLEVWNRVLPQISAFAPVVAYDRAGLGKSAWDNKTPNPKHATQRLRELLRKIGADPPYLLVGYSWGGVLARYFAGYYSNDVAGIVYVDPSPIVTQSFAEELAPYDSVGVGKAGYDALWSGFAAAMKNSSPAVNAEINVMRMLMELDVNERDLSSVPNVPIVVLVAAKPYPPFLKLPYDQQKHFQIDVRHRIRKLQEWALGSSNGTLIVSNHTTHAIPREDPDLIVWAIKRVHSAITTPP